ncbi:MAG: hypothetical protein IPN85_18745 [Flavobacteriales bacterium]|nr:hypothetical protein [Flavobacteriales bacterium]
MRKLPMLWLRSCSAQRNDQGQDYAQEPAPPPAPKEKKDPPVEGPLVVPGGVNLKLPER